MRSNKAILLLLPGLLLLLLLSGWYVGSDAFSGMMFRDEAANHVGIYLEEERILTSDPEAVLVEGSTATIVRGGEYRVSGSLRDGQLLIEAPEDQEVVLKLDSVDIHCERSAPIWAKSADKVKLSLTEDSINRFSDGTVYDQPEAEEKYPGACVYAQCDLTVKGKGQLTVEAHYRNGIQSTDSLHLRNGVVLLTAPHYALRGKDEITMSGGIYALTCGDTALSTLGYVDIQGGELSIDTPGSAIHAITAVTVGEESRVKARCGLLPVQCGGSIQLAYPIVPEGGE